MLIFRLELSNEDLARIGSHLYARKIHLRTMLDNCGTPHVRLGLAKEFRSYSDLIRRIEAQCGELGDPLILPEISDIS